jgi:hypothetical protein
MLIFMMHDATEIVWKGGVNAGLNDTNAYSSATSFRKYYMNSRLDMDTKIVGVNAFNLGNDVQRYFYLAKTYGEDGTMITTKSLRADTKDQIVSYVEYLAPVVAGTVVEGAAALNPSDAKTFGATAVLQEGYSAVYVYGVDSNDAKRGTLYTNLNATNHARKSSVGSLTGYQTLLFEQIYRKKSGEVPELMITEIVPRTNNLLGEDIIAAHSSSHKIFTVFLQPISALAAALSTFISQNYGAKKHDRIKFALTRAMVLQTAWGVLSCALVYLTGGTLIRLLTATENEFIVSNAVMSMRICLPFFPILGALQCLRTAMQSMGCKTAPVMSSCVEVLMKLVGATFLVPAYGYLGSCVTEPMTWTAMLAFLLVAYFILRRKMYKAVN